MREIASVRPVSHGQKAVDPLKRLKPLSCRVAQLRVSHGQKAVDPLKPGMACRSCPAIWRLPRSEGRGPIEAPRRCHDRRRAEDVSHGQKAVDPLKLLAYRPHLL